MKNKGIICFILFLVLASTSFFSYVYFKVHKWDDVVYPGVKIEGIDVSGKTEKEVLDIVQASFSDKIIEKQLKINALGKEYNISYDQLNAEYNIYETVEEAFTYGKEMGMFSKFKLIKGNTEKNIPLNFKYDGSIIASVIENIKSDVNLDAVNAELKIDGRGVFKVTPEVVGKKVDEEKLKEIIISNINGDLDETQVDIEAPIEIIQPRIKESDLNSINSLIAESTTYFKTSSEGRAANVELAAERINGTILMPGDVFSFDDIVGSRTKANGFKEAIVIVNNEFVGGLGGGICQVSTTLYHAVLRTGLYSLERVNHSLPVGYSKLGQDATIAEGYIDYKFKNTFDYPVYIQSSSYNRELKFKIYSNDKLSKKTYEIVSEIKQTIEPKIVEIKDPNMYEGEREVIKRAHTGYKVDVYRIIKENGKFIKKELISRDSYAVEDGKVKVGTKKREVTENTQNETQDDTNQ